MASISGASSSNMTSSLFNSANMISGLASGLDTEGMIEGLVQSYQTKINSLGQKVTKTEWKQEAYRSIIEKMVGFNTKYTSYSSSTNLLSPNFFSSAVNVLPQGIYGDRVTASGKSNSDVILNAVKQLASSAQFRTSSNLKGGDGQSIEAASGLDLMGKTTLGTLSGSMTLTYGSSNISIQFDEVADVKALKEIKEKGGSRMTDAEALAQLINQKLEGQKVSLSGGASADAKDRIRVEASGNSITFKDKSSAGNAVYISNASKEITDALELDLKDAQKNKPATFNLGTMSLTKQVDNAEYLSKKSMNLSLDGTIKTITLPRIAMNHTTGKYNIVDAQGNRLNYTAENYVKVLNETLDKTFKGKVTASNVGEGDELKLRFDVQEGSNLVINTDVGDTLGIGRTATSYLNASKTLEDLLDLDDAYIDYYALRNGDDSYALDDEGNKQYRFAINNTVIGTYTKDTKLSEIISDINANKEAGVKVSYSQTTKNFLFTTRETGADSEITLGGGLAQAMFGTKTTDVAALEKRQLKTFVAEDAPNAAGQEFKIKVGDKEYGWTITDANGTSNMKNLLDGLNRQMSKDGLTASFSDKDGSLVVKKKNYDNNDVEQKVEYTTDFAKKIFDTLNNEAQYKKTSDEAGYTKGQDAKFNVTVNGETMDMVRSNNSVEIDGLTINFKDTFDGAEDAEGNPAVDSTGKPRNTVSFKSTTDSDKIVDAIKSMINDYNVMMAEIKAAYSTLPYQKSNGKFANYEPLTDDDRADMSEAAIERYEAKAKQGILFGDRTLSGLYDRLRNAFSPAGNDGGLLRAMGINVNYSITEGTQAVTLDESKLRAMLDSDPEAVADVFTRAGDGVMQSMKTQLDNYSRTAGEPKGILIQQAGSPLSSLSLMNNTWQTQIDNINTQIEKWQDKLTSQVEKYTSQFSRLEVLIQQMNSQSSTLAGLMGG